MRNERSVRGITQATLFIIFGFMHVFDSTQAEYEHEHGIYYEKLYIRVADKWPKSRGLRKLGSIRKISKVGGVMA